MSLYCDNLISCSGSIHTRVHEQQAACNNSRLYSVIHSGASVPVKDCISLPLSVMHECLMPLQWQPHPAAKPPQRPMWHLSTALSPGQHTRSTVPLHRHCHMEQAVASQWRICGKRMRLLAHLYTAHHKVRISVPCCLHTGSVFKANSCLLPVMSPSLSVVNHAYRPRHNTGVVKNCIPQMTAYPAWHQQLLTACLSSAWPSSE